MNILQQIFNDHFNTVIDSGINIRPTVIENVTKMLHCGDMKYGYALYACQHCGKFKVVPFRCKSRFCTSCGTRYSIRRANSMSFKLINCNHRHCVFTIPQQLRIFFRKDRSLLNCLFHAVRDVILRMFAKINKAENFTPGFICVLHTFGRSLQWNPHIHVLLSEGASGNFSVWRHVKHFNYTLLRNAFRTVLLNLLEDKIGTSFKKVKAYIYSNCPNGFYVYAKPAYSNNDSVIKYIGRYLGRPVIASSRIISYDGSVVTFKYNRHEDNKLIITSVPATEFIKMLIIHIPDKHFKMIRYYGIYAKHHINEKHFIMKISYNKRKVIKSLDYWQYSIMLSFGYNPLRCDCGHSMSILEISHNGTLLFEILRKQFNSS